MKKVTSAVMLICVIAVAFTGCATTTIYGIEVGNVPNIGRVYIRNAGATHWGSSISGGNLQDIDRSRFSERVDIRVVDATGAIFSRYNVPFDVASFVETNRSSETNAAGYLLFATVILSAIIIPSVLLGGY